MLSRHLPACKKQNYNSPITYIGQVGACWKQILQARQRLSIVIHAEAVDSAPAEACRNTCPALAALRSLPPSPMSPRLLYKSLAKLVSLAAEWIQSGVRRRPFITQQHSRGSDAHAQHKQMRTNALPARACLTRRQSASLLRIYCSCSHQNYLRMIFTSIVNSQ